MIDRVIVQKFKNIERANLKLNNVNVLVGGNNSGKTSILQAIHLGVSLAQTASSEEASNFSADRLIYMPISADFTYLKHKQPLTERGDPISITFESKGKSEEIKLTRGRNTVIKTVNPRSLYSTLGRMLTSFDRPFSIFVPGLAGIPLQEEYRVDIVIRRGVARGDANLFLRNVLYRILQDQSTNLFLKFSEKLKTIFPDINIKIDTDDIQKSQTIPIVFSWNGDWLPLEMVGTGVLQAIQILSYASLYNPRVLLLDEPDSHLHPDNQRKIAQTIKILTKDDEFPVQILMATHSRHMLDSLRGEDDVTFFRVKEGSVSEEADDWITTLVELGAVDKIDKIDLHAIKYLVLSEDKKAVSDKSHPLQILLRAAGFDMDEIEVRSFEGIKQAKAVELLSDFVFSHARHVKIMVHVDRDFLTQDEIDTEIRPRIEKYNNIFTFVTRWSDIEGYFCQSHHIAEVCGIAIPVAQRIVQEICKTYHGEFTLEFNKQRLNLEKYYRTISHKTNMIPNQIPLPLSSVRTKLLLHKLERVHSLANGKKVHLSGLVRKSTSLDVTDLKRFRERLEKS